MNIVAQCTCKHFSCLSRFIACEKNIAISYFTVMRTLCFLVKFIICVRKMFYFTVMRTLTGHKSSVRSLDFHPYGDYAASGSLDCNIKVKLVDLLDHHDYLCVINTMINKKDFLCAIYTSMIALDSLQ